MSRSNDSAFPFPSFNGPNSIEWGSPGLTVREEFAKAAMQGLLADSALELTYDDYALRSVRMADALIAELAKPVKS